MPRIRLMQMETRAGALPVVCMICGGPVAAHVRKMFAWRPRWLLALSALICFTLPLIPISLTLLIIEIFNVRRMTVECPMCARHTGYFAWRGFVIYAPILSLTVAVVVEVVLLAMDVVQGPGFVLLLLLTGLLFAASAVVGWVVRRMSVAAIEITDEWIVLNNVHPAFAEQMRLSRLDLQRTQTHPGWEEYDPYPRAAD
jgi:hypothetical protein